MVITFQPHHRQPRLPRCRHHRPRRCFVDAAIELLVLRLLLIFQMLLKTSLLMLAIVIVSCRDIDPAAVVVIDVVCTSIVCHQFNVD